MAEKTGKAAMIAPAAKRRPPWLPPGERGRTRGRMSKRDKIQILQDIMAERPGDYRRYGFNRAMRKVFLEQYQVKLDDKQIHLLIRDAEEDWRRADQRIYSKRHLIESLAKLDKGADSTTDRIRIRTEIAKLEGHYDGTGDVAGDYIEEKAALLGRIFREAGKRNS